MAHNPLIDTLNWNTKSMKETNSKLDTSSLEKNNNPRIQHIYPANPNLPRHLRSNRKKKREKRKQDEDSMHRKVTIVSQNIQGIQLGTIDNEFAL